MQSTSYVFFLELIEFLGDGVFFEYIGTEEPVETFRMTGWALLIQGLGLTAYVLFAEAFEVPSDITHRGCHSFISVSRHFFEPCAQTRMVLIIWRLGHRR